MTAAWWGAGFLGLLTVLGWLGRFHPVLELIPNTRSQLLIVAAVAIVAATLARLHPPTVLLAIVVLINGIYVIPYWFATPPQPAAGAVTVRAMQYNLFYGNDDVAAMAEHILAARADVVALHELLPDTWTRLVALLEAEYPHSYAEPFDEQEGQLSGGMALLSKNPLEPIAVDPRYSPPDRVLLAATTVVEGETITVVGLHPHASRFASRKVELRDAQIAGVVDLVQRTDQPVMVLADLNITPTSPTYQQFLSDVGWQDPHRSSGWNSTWPTWGGPLGFPIDHVLVSNHFEVNGYRTRDGAGSDHRSLVAEVSLAN